LSLVKSLNLGRLLQVGGSTYRFTDYFKGFEKAAAVREIFGERTEDVLRNLKVEFTWIGGYMWIDSASGRLMINSRYLRSGDRIDVYLDIIHELVHVRQLMEGKELFDSRYGYTDRPTEVDAYRHAVREARNLGLSDERICQYLKTEWMSNEDLKRLAETLSVKCANQI
jgi:hypothetical protein